MPTMLPSEPYRRACPLGTGCRCPATDPEPEVGAMHLLALAFMDTALGSVERALDDATAAPERAGGSLQLARLSLAVARGVLAFGDCEVRP